MNAAERMETARLVFRRPTAADAPAIFERYAGDREATRFMSWPVHETIAQTEAFLRFSDGEWERWPGGPYLIEARSDGRLLGGTGFAFETPQRAATGYILARDAWGLGHATEALTAVVGVAAGLGLRRLYALCHTDHHPSWRVLEKCGFAREGILRSHTEFPNLKPGEPCDVFSYGKVFP
jgi:RimJ/RimL family protein N-acetyltransferase